MGRGVRGVSSGGGGQSSLGYLFGEESSRPAPVAQSPAQPQVALEMRMGRSGGGYTSLGYLFGYGEQGRPATVVKPSGDGPEPQETPASVAQASEDGPELSCAQDLPAAAIPAERPAAGIPTERPAAGVPSEKDCGKPRFPWQNYEHVSPQPSPKLRARPEPPG